MFLRMTKTNMELSYMAAKHNAGRVSAQVRRIWSLTAQDELMLICGGGYIKISGGNVEVGGPGKLLVKSTGIRKAGTGSMQGVMKSFEPECFDEKFIIRNTLTQEPRPGKAYKITMPNGSVVTGITDSQGATTLNSSDMIDDMVIPLTGR
ncbi:DUF2345 domain-containing protein [Enterobacter cloacae]|uniref:DUF2345 domain-containing protein n=1 Tax=Enterobacter cloacae TaxID=550 RepID=UPI00300D93BF